MTPVIQLIISKFGPLGAWFFTSLIIFARYALFAGSAYLMFYVWRRKKFLYRKIQQKFPTSKQIKGELLRSLETASIFAFLILSIYTLNTLGLARLYTDIHAYSIGYFVFSIVALIFIHDTYFYWMHYGMHRIKGLQKIHAVHHYSHNPTPFTSLSFHPIESVLEFAIVPIVIMVMPMHPIALVLFGLWSLAWNIIGHLGYELFPKNFVKHPILKWFNTSTHHNLHHKRSNCNYGLYFNFWDRLMGTNHKQYERIFQEIKAR